MQKKYSTIIAAVFSTFLAVSGAEKIFDLSFDDYTVTPQIAKGSKQQRGFTEPDLQLRMYQGVKGKRNALNIANSEKLSYEMKGNFNPKQGTVILWIAPHNWDVSKPKFQLFFSAVQNKYNFRIAKTGNNYISATISYKIPYQGKKTFGTTVKARVDSVDWKRGRYHQVAVTWNDKVMNLYIDGRKPVKTPIFIGNRRVPPTVGTQKFSSPVNFPEPNGVLHIGGNTWTPKHAIAEHSTAFDQITIYDNVLSPEQIQSEYEKIIPPEVKKTVNMTGIPKLPVKNHIPDGDLARSVWQKAAKVLLMPIGNAPEKNLFASIWHNGKNLHVGFSTDIPCQKKNHTERDSKIWEDDVFEFHIRTADKNHYQYIVNGNGTVFDQLNGRNTWNSKAKVAVKHHKKGWTAELVIPLTEFNAGEFDGDFCAASRPGILYHSYRWGSSGRHFGPSGKMRINKRVDVFRLDTLGNIQNGNLNMTGFSSNDTQLKITPAGEQPLTYPIKKGKFNMALRLQGGRQNVEISGKNILWSRNFVVRHPLNLAFDFAMERNELDTQVDFSSADENTKKMIEKSGLDVTLSLKNSSGKVAAEKTFRIRKITSHVSMLLPADLAAGNYQLEGKAGNIVVSIPLRRPDLAPYKAKLGADSTVPAPWIPVRQISEKVFQVWGRTYEFNNSPLPQQITHGGEKLLADAPVWKLDGKVIQWTGFKVVSKNQDNVAFSGKAQADKISFNWKGELWFDGAYILKMELAPLKNASVSNFNFDYSVAPEVGRYAMTPGYVKWKNNKVEVPLGPGDNRKENLLWLSGVEKGVMIWTESNANWVSAPGTAPFTAGRGAEKTKVAVQIINKKVQLKQKIHYTFVFMATPSRPFPARHRSVNYGGFSKQHRSTHQSTGWGQFKNRQDNTDPVYFNCTYPAYPDKFQKGINTYKKRIHRTKLHYYTMPGVLSSAAPDSDYWSKTKKIVPEESYLYTKGGQRHVASRFCHRVTSAPADLWTWTLKKLLTDFPDMGGLYFDCASTRFCANGEHACSGVDVFGQPYFTSDALYLRRFFMRIYKVHKSFKDKSMMIHSHIQFVPFVHSFTDFFAPGENTAKAVFKNQEYPYTEEISLEEYQSDYNSRKSGVAYCMILQLARAAGIMPSLSHYRKLYLKDPEYIIRAITPFLLHDVNIWDGAGHKPTVTRYWILRDSIDMGASSRFIGYWEKDSPVERTTDKVFCSVYEWQKKAPYRRVLAVGNFSRMEQKTGLVIDWKKLGVEKPETVRELWTDKEIPVSEIGNFKLKGSHFALFGIK
ncbi:MAG: hypothetical protein IKA32_07825 [Lentisphaeria bacterium]|nr:hypothetical protein [Lentisphaeria bacterium]